MTPPFPNAPPCANGPPHKGRPVFYGTYTVFRGGSVPDFSRFSQPTSRKRTTPWYTYSVALSAEALASVRVTQLLVCVL